MRPNYKKIYLDMLKQDQPEKLKDPKIQTLLQNLKTTEDVLNFNIGLLTESVSISKKDYLDLEKPIVGSWSK